MTCLLANWDTLGSACSTGGLVRESVLPRDSPTDRYDPTEDDRPEPVYAEKSGL